MQTKYGEKMNIGIYEYKEEKTSTVNVVKPWNKLLREVVEYPSLEFFTTRLDKMLCDSVVEKCHCKIILMINNK